jgi:hypothetical protein
MSYRVTEIDESRTTDGTTYTLGLGDWFVQSGTDTVVRSRQKAAYVIDTGVFSGDYPVLQIMEGRVRGVHGVEITGEQTATVMIERDGRIEATDTGILTTYTGSLDVVTVSNAGTIKAGVAGMNLVAFDDVDVWNTGKIEVQGNDGADVVGGIFAYSYTGASVVNAGEISVSGDGTAYGVTVESGHRGSDFVALWNLSSGIIRSSDIAVLVDNYGAEAIFRNDGRVEGDVITEQLENTGTISGNVQITGTNVTNTGVITGTIDLDYEGVGAVTLDGRMARAGQTVTGSDAQDIILASGHNDFLKGFDGDDWLFSGGGRDTLDGGEGDDHLVVEISSVPVGSNSTLRGGDGDDVFVFVTQSGRHTIRDFENGDDKIDLSSWSDYDTFGDLPRTLFRQDGDDVVMDLTAISRTGLIRLEDVDLSDLGASDFIF